MLGNLSISRRWLYGRSRKPGTNLDARRKTFSTNRFSCKYRGDQTDAQ